MALVAVVRVNQGVQLAAPCRTCTSYEATPDCASTPDQLTVKYGALSGCGMLTNVVGGAMSTTVHACPLLVVTPELFLACTTKQGLVLPEGTAYTAEVRVMSASQVDAASPGYCTRTV